MTANSKRVFYLRYLSDPIYLKVLAARPEIRVDNLADSPNDAATAESVAAGHVYQINSARDELAADYWADAGLFARAPNLLVVSTNGAGYDTVDVDACTEAGVLAVNQAGGNREAVAEHVLGMMLTLSKRFNLTDKAMRRGSGIVRLDYMGNDIFGKTIGVVGFGNVGSRIGELCRGLFQMKVLAYDPYLSADDIARRGGEKVELDDLLRRSDFVSINCPRTRETTGLIGARQYALMQPHAFFINTARGGIHDEAALAEALKAKRLAGAGLDVWDKEPPPHDHPLLQMDTVVASPHTTGITREARLNIARIAAEQVVDILDGKRPPRILNPEVWPVYARRFEATFGFRPAD